MTVQPKRPPGRPTFGEKPMQRYNVMLDDETVEAAKRMGGGELSAGLRIAVKRSNER